LDIISINGFSERFYLIPKKLNGLIFPGYQILSEVLFALPRQVEWIYFRKQKLSEFYLKIPRQSSWCNFLVSKISEDFIRKFKKIIWILFQV
jgi:hypothetical protein